MKNKVLLPLIVLVLLVAGCAAPSEPESKASASYQDISIETLNTMMAERRESFVLVNTHIPFEGNLPDTDLSIPYNEILNNLHQLPADKDAEIVVYCRSDNMSNAAAADLVHAGYTNVKNLTGGFVAWNAAGYPLELTP